jgi:hypothetical protein
MSIESAIQFMRDIERLKTMLTIQASYAKHQLWVERQKYIAAEQQNAFNFACAQAKRVKP